MEYLDFDLEVSSGTDGQYTVRVVRSPAGEAEEVMRFPYDKAALENVLKDLQIALLRSGNLRRKMISREEKTVQEFGRKMFDALITGEVRTRYDLSRNNALNQQGKGLRIRLRIKPSHLAALPWEYLYDSRDRDYVCLSRRTPIIRYPDTPQPVQRLAIAPPLQILGVAVSAHKWPELDLKQEKSRVTSALGKLPKGSVMLKWMEGQTWRDLQQEMQKGEWHILHFIGHGEFDESAEEGGIMLDGDDGEPQFLSGEQLGRVLADHSSLRVVLLNSCEGARASEMDSLSSTAATLIRRGLPAVVAMQYEITDLAAIEFSRAFYEALVNSYPIDAAIGEARKAMSLAHANTMEWGTPVLYMRSPDGRIFDITNWEAPGPVPKGWLRRLASWVASIHWAIGLSVIAVILVIVGAYILFSDRNSAGPEDVRRQIPPVQQPTSQAIEEQRKKEAVGHFNEARRIRQEARDKGFNIEQSLSALKQAREECHKGLEKDIGNADGEKLLKDIEESIKILEE